MRSIRYKGRRIELIGDNTKGQIDFGYELINIRPNQPRRFEWFRDHTSSKGVLAVCYKLADVCRFLNNSK